MTLPPPPAAAERGLAVAPHLAALVAAALGAVVAGAAIGLVAAPLGPLLALAALRLPYPRRHAREAVAFNLTFALVIGAALGAVLAIRDAEAAQPAAGALILFSILAILNWLMLTLFGAWRAWRGERAFRYPFALPVAGLLAHRAHG